MSKWSKKREQKENRKGPDRELRGAPTFPDQQRKRILQRWLRESCQKVG